MNILPEQASYHKVTLEEVLLSREARQERQQLWLAKHQTTLISLTVVVPGEIKDSTVVRQAFNLAWQTLDKLCQQQKWNVVDKAVFCLPTGPEGLIAIGHDAREVKRACVESEEQSTVGRLWDIDVIGSEGIISRQSMNIAPRQCFLCSRDARICARERTHSVPALHQAMEDLINHV
ncbi:citrate lyase holo-[acyl-carrier protein] synthase [Limnobaculum zhutongyuii]|uniref:Apo-citrate lyase phosphoribosyl-dephospho-CoA transferase n=1 Tax=Limnobaculum zhutongyuii TaxID=2498113 RepID=A0A411WNH5_9GAMM|nr:citrate lyase holo-[acyl-carrier protein] synthase [Limnobaculum zhutongyuii]QBH97791.1 citrate lyase holo-[acyl-carrier protein] synthase [Limnobaculum zhutongyuii]TQS87919.1 citrate lyase holo-[acyl-carrier protein] synthase [Limnobaculum zhutongyuii]